MKKNITLFIFTLFASYSNAQKLEKTKNSECNCYGFKDSIGKLVIEYKYDYAGDFSEGLAHVRLNKKSGFIDEKDNVIVPFNYEWADAFSEGLAPVKLGDKWGYVNTSGILVIPTIIEGDRVDGFSQGLAAVRLKGKWGFVDTKGQLVIPHIFDRAYPFKEGLAAVEPVAQQGYGFINQKGEMVIPAQFKYAYNFSDGVAMVSTANRSSLHIDKTGKILEVDNTTSTNKTITTTKTQNVLIHPGNIPYSDKDRENLKIAKDAGNLEYIGYMYINHGATQEGTKLLKQAIANGTCDNCAYFLAVMSYKNSFPKSKLDSCEQAADNLSKSGTINSSIAILRKIDAEGHMPIAAYYLAEAFAKGKIHPPNKEIDSAIYFQQKAATQGYPPAMYALGLLYEYGTGDNFPTPTDRNKNAYLIDQKRARYWFNESSKIGYKPATEKVSWLDKSAELTELAKAYGKGYDAFESGNYQEAYRWWKTATIDGKDAEAYYGLAILHQMGKAPNSSLSSAMEYYQEAANLGMKEAMNEKKKIQQYLESVESAKKNAAKTSTASTIKQADSYSEWWEKTWGRGGTQNHTTMPNNNIPQARYRTGTLSESDRHQQAMDAIQRSIERQQNRDYKNKNY
ncbi:MAG: hypothetical protein DI598_05880 [Pseudopedobacter saltans]|uniref:Sel1 domain protein repeat-containing protein n=1 Tax=Pseudopedobacter saltans TaxID=151895 RepID=A0A2W5H3R2_9SPHI|nr:MAG: hypothetical protein DI598_05880 [Pseudopedobacter saltans]